MTSVYIPSADLEKIKQIFAGISNVYLFGSRIRGNHNSFSDVDICIWYQAPTSSSLIGDLKEKLQNSEITLVVDLSDFHDLPEFIQAKIAEEKVNLRDATAV